MKQYNWKKDYEDNWSTTYKNADNTKEVNYSFIQNKLEMVFYSLKYSKKKLDNFIQEIKEKFGVVLEETVSLEKNDVLYSFNGEAVVSGEKCVIGISTDKKRYIMISYCIK